MSESEGGNGAGAAFTSSSSSSTPYSSSVAPNYPDGRRNALDLAFDRPGRVASAGSGSKCGIVTSISLMSDLYFVSEKLSCSVGSWPDTLKRARL